MDKDVIHKDTIFKAKVYDIVAFNIWSRIILGLVCVAGGILFYVLRALWEDTVLFIVAIWGFLLFVVIVALIVRAVGKANDKRFGKPVPAREVDDWRLPDAGSK